VILNQGDDSDIPVPAVFIFVPGMLVVVNQNTYQGLKLLDWGCCRLLICCRPIRTGMFAVLQLDELSTFTVVGFLSNLLFSSFVPQGSFMQTAGAICVLLCSPKQCTCPDLHTSACPRALALFIILCASLPIRQHTSTSVTSHTSIPTYTTSLHVSTCPRVNMPSYLHTYYTQKC